jgi:hypothetical protein
MSRGYGAVERTLLAVFQANVGKTMLQHRLVWAAFPGKPVTRSHKVSVKRALDSLSRDFELNRKEVDPDVGSRFSYRFDG